MAITAAEKVLIADGVLNLAYGVLLGYLVTVIRAKGAPAVPKYLMAAHFGASARRGAARPDAASLPATNWPAACCSLPGNASP